jgi:hypothetical protein
MQIGDRVVINQRGHFLYKLEGSIVGFRGERSPGDIWLLILVDSRKRSFLIPQSMVKIISEQNGTKIIDIDINRDRYS